MQYGALWHLSTKWPFCVDAVRCAVEFVHKMALMRGCSAVRCGICPQNGHSVWMQCGALWHLSTKWCFCVDAVRCAAAFVHKMVLLRGCSAVRCSVCSQNSHSVWMECGEDAKCRYIGEATSAIVAPTKEMSACGAISICKPRTPALT